VTNHENGHLDEQQLLDYRYGDAADAPAVKQHLHDCADCRKSYEALLGVLAMVEAVPVPEPSANFEARMWREISPKLARPRFDWSAWTAWASPRRLVPIGAVAALIVAAFLAGRYMPRRPDQGTTTATQVAEKNPAQVRERILLVAVGDHLDRAQNVLLEISNAEPGDSAGADKDVDISLPQQGAEEMLTSNRLYRQTAARSGDEAVASVLDELEPVLLEIAQSPSHVSASQLDELQRSIAARGLLLKVRVLDSNVRSSEKPAPARQSRSGS
jgi:hypothetical protein